MDFHQTTDSSKTPPDRVSSPECEFLIQCRRLAQIAPLEAKFVAKLRSTAEQTVADQAVREAGVASAGHPMPGSPDGNRLHGGGNLRKLKGWTMSGPNSSGCTAGTFRSVLNAFLLPAVHWKNGGGITREIAIAPPGAGFADFDWRLSIADIVESGPFSSLPGVDRHFLMGTKGSLKMTIDGRPRQLAMGSGAVFAGEAEVAVEVLQGPTRNLNLMTRRGACGGSIEMLQLDGPFLVGAGRGPVAVVALGGTVELKDGTTLEPFHVLIPGPDEEPVLGHDALVAAVRVWRKPPA